MRRIDARSDRTTETDTISTGFPSVDQLLGGGFRHGDLIALGGDVGAGKSAFALAVALRVALSGVPVAYFTGEATVDRVLERMLSVEGRARLDDLRRGTFDDATRASVGVAALRLRDVSPMVDRLPPSLDGLVEALKTRQGVRLVVVDSLEVLAPGRARQAEELATIVRALKAYALDSGVAVLAVTHLHGELGGRQDRRPTLDDFGALHAIKQHSDIVLALYREEMYQGSLSLEGATELITLKNRNGPTGYVDLYYYKQWMRFEDLLER